MKLCKMTIWGRCRIGLGDCIILLPLVVCLASAAPRNRKEAKRVTYYFDSKEGSDRNEGMSKAFPWKTLSRLHSNRLQPGDSLCFKRGSSFVGPLIVRG